MKTVNVEFGSHVKLPPIEKSANSESTPMNLLLSQFYDGGRGESAMTSSEIRFKSTNRHLTSSDIL